MAQRASWRATARNLALGGGVLLGVVAVVKAIPFGAGYPLASVAPSWAPPPSSNPPLRVTAVTLVVRAAPALDSAVLGLLHTGARIVRSEQPIGREGCAEGWYAIRPAGVVCAGDGVILDEASAPNLPARTSPNAEGPLPYRYMKTTVRTWLFSGTGKEGATATLARRVSEAPLGTWLAITKQGTAIDLEGKSARVAFTPQGLALSTYDLEPIKESALHGVVIEDVRSLPIGFVAREGVTPFRMVDGKGPTPMSAIARHTVLALNNKSHRRGSERYLGLDDGNYVRARDITLVQPRTTFPAFAESGTKWLDVSVVTGTLVAYEGKKPVFATLVSVGTDKAKGTKPTALGTFQIVGKQITVPDPAPGVFDDARELRDVPWVMELSGGQKIHGAIWHDRFGLEFGPGNIQMAPADAAFVFRWVDGAIPEGWHGVVFSEAERSVQVVVR